jgi:excisionase family DNA binding protein
MRSITRLTLVPKEYVSVKELAQRSGISKSTVYEWIRSDPSFPYRNVGLKKKLMIHSAKFESWIEQRTEKEKNEHFGLSTGNDLLEKYRK